MVEYHNGASWARSAEKLAGDTANATLKIESRDLKMELEFLKNDDVLRISGKIAITSLKGHDQYPVWLMCKALDLSPRSRQGRLSRELAAPTPAQIRLNRLSLLVPGVFKDRKGKFGARRLAHHLLAHKGIKVCCRRIIAILKTNDLACLIRRKACFQ